LQAASPNRSCPEATVSHPLENIPALCVVFLAALSAACAAPREEPEPTSTRVVKILAIQPQVPEQGSSQQDLRDQAVRLTRTLARHFRPDIILLPEYISSLSAKGKPAEVAEPIPGPTFEALAKVAREFDTYIIGPVYERREDKIYDSAFLVDRHGKLVGVYSKSHCPQAERDNGVTPGDELPVFKTDFGTIGIMICFDHWFPEVPEVLALRGAEIIFMPHVINGPSEASWETKLRARAIDNVVTMVTASYAPKPPYAPGMVLGRSCIVGPDGTIIADAGHEPGAAFAEIDLSRPYLTQGISVSGTANLREALRRERRPELYGDIAKTK
jgi:predicted amidohydrolase